MHLLYGFDPLIGQDALKCRNKELPNRNYGRFQILNQKDILRLDIPYLSYFIQDDIK